MHAKNQQGFTLIELTIALAFLSVLLIAILTLTLAAGKMYVKGTTNKTINQSGREIQDIMRRDFLAADRSRISAVATEGSVGRNSGRICLGSVSYVWNTAGMLNDKNADATNYQSRIRIGSGEPVRLMRVVDANSDMCARNPATGRLPRTIAVSSTNRAELLGGEGREFALYEVNITPIISEGVRGMYRVKYTIGTNDIGTTEREGGTGYVRCKPDATATANFDYCSVVDFDMMLRIEGGVR